MGSYYEIDTDAVYAAGRQVAGHVPAAGALASRFITSLDHAHGTVHHAVMVAAVARYQEHWQPHVNRVAPQIDALGTNTSSSATHIGQSDQDATGLLARHGSATEALTSQLTRPINAN